MAKPVVTLVNPADRDHRFVGLRDLGVAPENLRFAEPPDDDLPTLAATLRAAGQLAPLTVRPGRGRREAAFMALDGRRRLLALGLLRDAGDIADDHPVEIYVETDPARQAAAVVLTNTAAPVHVADVIAAIGRMLKSKLGVAGIARALGYGELEIKRLGALSTLPAVALEALKTGRLNLRQARLLARLPNTADQAEIAQKALDGFGFQDWRVTEALDAEQVTVDDPRFALVAAERYAQAGGRTEADLFGERAPVLLDPAILTEVWMRRAREIALPFEATGLEVHVTAGEDPDLPEDLETLGYVYGGSLPAEEMARYRAQREICNERTEAVRLALSGDQPPDLVDLAIVDMIRARIAADQTGCGGRVVTTLVMWPTAGAGVEVRCYTPEEPEPEVVPNTGDEDPVSRAPAPPAYVAPEVAAPEPDTDGVNHALHAVRTDVATRGLIRALADDPGAALTALIARLFTTLVLRTRLGRQDSALAVQAAAFDPPGGRVIDALDGEVRQRLDDRRAAWQASGRTVIGWVHGLSQGDRLGLLAELTAICLDVREEKTVQIRRGARSEAAELAALCDADITLHWTPDAPFQQPHPKALLMGMLEAMGADDDRACTLKKTELVDWVAEQAAARAWAPAGLSWRAVAGPDAADEQDRLDRARAADSSAAGDDEGDDGVGAFVVTASGEAALVIDAA